MKTILEVLGESSVRAIIIALATACVLRALRVKSPGICHHAWTGVLMAMLCLPFFSLWAPRIAIPVLPTPSISSGLKPLGPATDLLQERSPNDPAAERTPAKALSSPKSSIQTRIANHAASWMSVHQIAGILYFAGFCVLALRLLAGTVLSCRFARGASRHGKIFYSPQCTVPITVGLFHPRICLPAESKDWDPGKMDAVLTHEKEHMRRRDPLVEHYPGAAGAEFLCG